MSMSNLGIQRSASDANLERFTSSKSYKKSHLHLPNNIKKSHSYSKESDSSNTGDSIGGKVGDSYYMNLVANEAESVC